MSDTERKNRILNMHCTEVEKLLRTNNLTENEILLMLDKPTVSWGDAPPIVHPTEGTIKAVLEKHAQQQPEKHDMDISALGFSCDVSFDKVINTPEVPGLDKMRCQDGFAEIRSYKRGTVLEGQETLFGYPVFYDDGTPMMIENRGLCTLSEANSNDGNLKVPDSFAKSEALIEDKDFVVGDGTNKPRGMLSCTGAVFPNGYDSVSYSKFLTPDKNKVMAMIKDAKNVSSDIEHCTGMQLLNAIRSAEGVINKLGFYFNGPPRIQSSGSSEMIEFNVKFTTKSIETPICAIRVATTCQLCDLGEVLSISCKDIVNWYAKKEDLLDNLSETIKSTPNP